MARRLAACAIVLCDLQASTRLAATSAKRHLIARFNRVHQLLLWPMVPSFVGSEWYVLNRWYLLSSSRSHIIPANAHRANCRTRKS